MASSVPASEVGKGVMDKTIWSTALVQEPFPLTVKVKSTDPVAISDMPGVYTGFEIDAFEKLPSPELVQLIPLLLVAVPFKV